ncbi:MAG: hypothetical protein HC888_07370 [Candidatus Competibacteraceae bacterium]|nr:hypothetical protein [Candidatus Competibacteraceae bacterium]
MFRGYDWSAVIPFVDLEHEVVLVDDDDDEGNRLRRRLKVIDGLEVFEARPPEEGGPLNIKSKGPGGLPPAPAGGLGVRRPKVPFVAGRDLASVPNPPPTDKMAPKIPQKGKQTNQYDCPDDLGYGHSGARYRLATSGKGQCSEGEQKAVNEAFWMAYQFVRSAEVEMAEWEDRSVEDKQYFWQAYQRKGNSTLETWFGGATMPFFEERFKVVLETLKAVSFRYRHGFYSVGSVSADIPVTIKCRPDMDDGPVVASHTAINVITLKKLWWGFEAPQGRMDMRRPCIVVHEMFHWCRNDFVVPLGPGFNLFSSVLIQNIWLDDLDDRKDDACVFGVFDEKNKCYQQTGAIAIGEWEWGSGPFVLPIEKPFAGNTGYYLTLSERLTNPGVLVENFDLQVDGDAMYKMMGNIDNFVSYLWNRWVDHGYCRLNSQAPTQG